MGIVSVRIRKQIWRKCDGHCAYCGKPVEFKGPDGFQVDHLHPTYWKWDDEKCKEQNVIRGSDDYENLMPACRRCNRWKTEDDVETFRSNIIKQVAIMELEVNGFRLLTDYKVVKVDPTPVVFYYERMAGYSVSKQLITGK